MARRRRRPRKKKSRSERRRAIYVLPNLFTTASLFAGFFAITSSINGSFKFAAMAILASLVFDGLDGKVARATNTVSQFGVEYDSLADLVAFGVAPSVMVYMWALAPMGRMGILAGFLFVACGALRLARFNVQVNVVGTKHFVGLPIPAAASMIATTVLLMGRLGHTGVVSVHWPVLGMVFVLSFLMVSNISYLSFKELGLGNLKSFNCLVGSLLFFILVAVEPCIMGFAIMAGYVALGNLGARYMAKKRKQAKQEEEAAKPAEDPLTDSAS